jgi:hypothetical protein
VLGSRVWVVIANAGDLRHGQVNLGAGTSSGWHGLKAHFLGVPAYAGPFLVRARRLDRPGPVRLGSAHTRLSWTIEPGGPTPTGGSVGNWRDVVSSTWVKQPGCYGWQIDGLTFSEKVVVHVLPLNTPPP